jgi:hypothetical protein
MESLNHRSGIVTTILGVALAERSILGRPETWQFTAGTPRRQGRRHDRVTTTENARAVSALSLAPLDLSNAPLQPLQPVQ